LFILFGGFLENDFGERQMSTTITEEQLNKLYHTIGYASTVLSSCREKYNEKSNRVLIYENRADDSILYLDEALDLVEQLQKELK
jgi:hypothetical protein